jgi:flavin reductase (DIM6/NTAB) family NADH-FMN oxidoreductase RutF
MNAPLSAALDADRLRRTFGRFPSGVIAVCGIVDGTPIGMAASSFTSVSLEPPLASFCVANESTTWRALRTGPRIGLSVLSADQVVACKQLSAKAGDRFAGIAWHLTETGAVLLDGAAAWLECTIETEIPAGDHKIILFRIHSLGEDRTVTPLVFHDSSFRQLAI